MSNRLTNLIATGLLIFVFIIAVFSMKDDSLTSDELVHLPAGYSYLTQRDMRLNPEHPPLIKDLSAFPLLFIGDIKFPYEIKAWQENVNDQWEFGSYFSYRMGNPVEKMIFWGRIPMILILILLGFYIFKWTKEAFGNKVALLSLFFFSFSPTFLAHGKLVTTDVGAAAGVFIATYYFIKFLKDSSRKNLIIAGIVLGLAQLAKFSVILLLPFFGILIIIWAITKSSGFREFLKTFGRYFVSCFLIGLIALSLIWAVYQYHTWNYPPEKQAQDTKSILAPSDNEFLSHLTIWMADKPILRPIAHYLLGLIMAIQRTATGGDVSYFLGEVSGSIRRNYFPVVYAIKEPLAFHFLTLIALLYLAWLIKKPFWVNTFERVKNWIKNHFPEFAMLIFLGIYWLTSLTSHLQIGVRHLLPVFPFTMILVSATIINWLKEPRLKIKFLFPIFLLGWQVISVIKIYPHFLAYFNEIAGGPENGYIYVADSNLDWGQDLKRLSQWVDEKGVDKIYVDYSGGYDKRYYSAEKYYLREKFVPWWRQREPKELPKGSYLAVSAFFLQRGRGIPASDLSPDQPTGYYRWLDKYPPVAKIGYSIFVYHIE